MRVHSPICCANQIYGRASAKITLSKMTTSYLAYQTLLLTERLLPIKRVYSGYLREFIFKSGWLKNSSSVSARQYWCGGPSLVGRYVAGCSDL